MSGLFAVRRWCGVALWAGTSVLGFAWSAAGAEEPAVKKVLAKTFDLDNIWAGFDGQWQGIHFASDGNCYFACCSHSPDHGAGFFKYDPRTKEMKILAEDVTRTVGEDPTKTTPQGKIHSDIVEADGWLYFATHMGTWEPARFTGAHVLGYETATGKFRDFGVIRPKHVIYSGITVDLAKKCLYAYLTPAGPWRQKQTDTIPDYMRDMDGSHLYRIDIATGDKKDLGLVAAWDKIGACAPAAFYFRPDKRSDVWFTLTNHTDDGALYCLRWATGRIERLPDALPLLRSWEEDKEAAAPLQARRCWHAALPMSDGERLLIKDGSSKTHGGTLWTFDPRKPVKEAFQPVVHLGAAKAITLVGDKVYFLQGEGKFAGRDGNVRLKTLTLGQGGPSKVGEVGLIVDQKGHKVRDVVMAADKEGRVYLIASWFVLPGEQGCIKGNQGGKRMEWRMMFGVIEPGQGQ